MGLAVYNGVILDVRFPHCCFKKLLSPPVVPRVLDIHSIALGILPLTLEDLEEIIPVRHVICFVQNFLNKTFPEVYL